jgi:hypothetical protein
LPTIVLCHFDFMLCALKRNCFMAYSKRSNFGNLSEIFYAAVIFVTVCGCQTQLMPTPNHYLHNSRETFAAVPPEFRNNKVDILYATDRKPVVRKDGKLQYGFDRSASMAYGSCVVEIGKNVSWDNLIKNSFTDKRTTPLSMTVLSRRSLEVITIFIPAPRSVPT